MGGRSLDKAELERLLEQVLALAREAGRRILDVYERAYMVETKDDASPVTEADMAAHEVIVDGLQSLPHAWPVLSEESVDIPFSARARWDTYWLVDPLDGTREFIKRNGEFTVNIALIHDHEPVLGVVYVPVKDLFYYAARGLGAWRREDDRPARRIHVRRAGQGPVIIAGSRSHASPRLQEFVRNVGEAELVSMGSSLKSCLVAEGRADVYPRLGPTSEWDTAAAQCVVEEAGGHVTDLQGRRLLYNTKESLLNPEFLVFGDDSVGWRGYLPRNGGEG